MLTILLLSIFSRGNCNEESKIAMWYLYGIFHHSKLPIYNEVNICMVRDIVVYGVHSKLMPSYRDVVVTIVTYSELIGESLMLSKTGKPKLTPLSTIDKSTQALIMF